jgi:hypothetical protein
MNPAQRGQESDNAGDALNLNSEESEEEGGEIVFVDWWANKNLEVSDYDENALKRFSCNYYIARQPSDD